MLPRETQGGVQGEGKSPLWGLAMLLSCLLCFSTPLGLGQACTCAHVVVKLLDLGLEP